MLIDCDLSPTIRSEDEMRSELKLLLRDHFHLFEEVTVEHALFRRRRLRCDLVAIPRDDDFADLTIAFETKPLRSDCVDSTNYQVDAVRQAQDYVLSRIVDDRVDLEGLRGRRILACHLYPTPPHEDTYLRGMMALAGTNRVGRVVCGANENNRATRLSSLWAAGCFWERGKFTPHARGILAGKRKIGSQKFSILDELSALEGCRR